jgi:hypothetical protein
MDRMGEQELPNHVKAFVTEHIDSVLQLELLLQLRADPQRRWAAAGLASELRIDAAWAARELDDLCRRGLLKCDPSAPPEYRYAPAPELDRTVTDLADAYATRRVTVIGLIFSKPIDKLRSFADAFRIRQDDDPEQ